MDFASAFAVLQQRSQQPPELLGQGGDGLIGEPRCAECAVDRDMPALLMPAGTLASLSIRALVQRFMERQEERVGVYRHFEEGFLLFLEVAEADGYQALVKQATGVFATVSAAVNELEAVLRERGAAAQLIANAIRTIQGLEREKLQATAQLHIVRHGLAIDALRDEHVAADDDDDGDAETTGCGGGVAYAVGGGGGGSRASALRAEEADGLTRQLAEITSSLNEALDEIRAEVADMEDEDVDVV